MDYRFWEHWPTGWGPTAQHTGKGLWFAFCWTLQYVTPTLPRFQPTFYLQGVLNLMLRLFHNVCLSLFFSLCFGCPSLPSSYLGTIFKSLHTCQHFFKTSGHHTPLCVLGGYLLYKPTVMLWFTVFLLITRTMKNLMLLFQIYRIIKPQLSGWSFLYPTSLLIFYKPVLKENKTTRVYFISTYKMATNLS